MFLLSLLRGPTTTDRLVRAARQEPLSDVLPAVQSVARQASLDDLWDWVSLEMRGYYEDNPGAHSDTKRPKYREVRGRYIDQHKTEINIQGEEYREKLNAVRLPQPVSTLERLADSDDGHLVQNPRGNLVQQIYGVTPAGFYISATGVQDVLGAIQHELIEKLEWHREALDRVDLPRKEVPGEEPSFFTRQTVGFVVMVIAGLVVAFLTFYFDWV